MRLNDIDFDAVLEPDHLDLMLGINPNDPDVRIGAALIERDRDRQQALRRRREAVGLSQADVARALNCTAEDVSGIEHHDPTLHQLRVYEAVILLAEHTRTPAFEGMSDTEQREHLMYAHHLKVGAISRTTAEEIHRTQPAATPHAHAAADELTRLADEMGLYRTDQEAS